MANNVPKDKPLLFISHKHENRNIADALRSFVELNTGGTVEVFQSSTDQASGPRAGFSLNQELRNALWRAGAFILIYTHSTLDWSYCMFEYGVANNPKTPDTRSILFRCCDALPSLFAGQVNVNARELVDIQRFTNQLLTDSDFFADYGGPVTRHEPNSQAVASAAAEFYQKLQPLLPPLIPASHEERYRWDRFTLRMPSDMIREVRECNKTDKTKALDILRNNAEVVNAFGQALLHFDYTEIAKGLTLGMLIARWRETIARMASADSPQGWIQELCEEMNRSIENRRSQPSWELMKSVQDPDWWFYPILNHVRLIPDGSCEFDVYLYRVPGALPAMLPSTGRDPARVGT